MKVKRKRKEPEQKPATSPRRAAAALGLVNWAHSNNGHTEDTGDRGQNRSRSDSTDSPQLEQWQKSLQGILNRHRRRRKAGAGEENETAAGAANDPRIGIGRRSRASCQHKQPYSTEFCITWFWLADLPSSVTYSNGCKWGNVLYSFAQVCGKCHVNTGTQDMLPDRLPMCTMHPCTHALAVPYGNRVVQWLRQSTLNISLFLSPLALPRACQVTNFISTTTFVCTICSMPVP